MTSTQTPPLLPVLVRRAARDLAVGLDAGSARWLVDYYYAIQDFRIQASGQVRAIEQEADEGTFAIGTWLTDETVQLEKTIRGALDAYSDAEPAGAWAKTIVGIGPVIAAGLLAHIDITKAPTVGHVWRFAGLDPTSKWEKGEKRPWNASLKVLCWKIGDSFVKQRNRPNDIYGKVYAERKEYEVAKNTAGDYADQAKASLETRKIRDKALRETLEAGMLPPGRIDLRARRYATKLFLAHYHHVAYETKFGEPPPKPYVIAHGGHTHYLAPPNWPIANG